MTKIRRLNWLAGSSPVPGTKYSSKPILGDPEARESVKLHGFFIPGLSSLARVNPGHAGVPRWKLHGQRELVVLLRDARAFLLDNATDWKCARQPAVRGLNPSS
ncbi:hypothetical protein BLAT2472_10394 [Burkholderia latens]